MATYLKTTHPLRVDPQYLQVSQLLQRDWTLAIIAALLNGKAQFNQLLEGGIPGITDRVLTKRLSELEAAGLVDRRVYDSKPIRVEYVLTPAGKSLRPVIEALNEWAQSHPLHELADAG